MAPARSHAARSQIPAAGGALLVAGWFLVSTARSTTTARGDAGDASPSPFERASALLRTAPTGTPPTPAPLNAGRCEIAGRVVPALAHPDLPDDEVVALRADVERALAEQPTACVPALAEAMANAAECGLAFDAVAIRWLRSKATTPLVAAGQLGRPTKCQGKLVSALREVERVEPPVAAAVLRLTSDTREEVRGTRVARARHD